MKILLIHNKYGIETGEERMVSRIADLLRERGHKVKQFFANGLSPNSRWTKKTKAFFSGIYSPEGVRQVKEALKTFEPDLVQVQNLYPRLSPWILPAIREEGIPIVMRCANYRLVCPNGLFLSRGQICERCLGGREYWCVLRNCEGSLPKSLGYALRNYIARSRRLYLDHVNLFYAQTEFQKRKLVEGGIPENRIAVIPNMMDADTTLVESPIGDYLAFVGRGSPEKGISTLLKAATKLPEILFRLAGDFWRLPQVEKQKPPNVEVLGHLSGARLVEFYRNCRLLVFPSTWYEGFPGVLLEAMYWGKPVVCSRLGGLSEIVEDGVHGLLFEPGDYHDLAKKVNQLWARPELCVEMGRRGREKVLREYSPQKYYQRLLEVYKKAFKINERTGLKI